MKVATILPTLLLNLTEDNDYHMCLYQEIMNNLAYRSFYKHQVNKGAFVIMDNGAAEGVNPSIEELIPAYDIINPSEIVLPDVVGDFSETYKRTLRSYTYLVERGLITKYQIMAVPQGANFNEWLECLEHFLRLPNITTIGISKFTSKLYKDELENINIRLECVDNVIRLAEKFNRQVQIHLLGCYNNPREIAEINEKYPGKVRGVDSAIAYVYSRNNEHIVSGNRPDQAHIDFRNEYILNMDLLKTNIKLWEQMLEV